jgi:ABC-2 type transport system permease protein
MYVINLALKDLTQVFRDRKSALFFLAMPVAFTLFFGSVFGNTGVEDPRLPVGLVVEDQAGVLGDGLISLLEASDTIRPVLLEEGDRESAAEAVGDQDLAAALVVPAGFTDRVWSGESPPLAVIADMASQAGQTARDTIQAIVFRVLSAAEAARISAESLGGGGDAGQGYREEGLALALGFWQQPPLAVRVEAAGGEADEEPVSNGYGQASPGMMVQFAIFGVMQAATVLVLERKCGALQRLLTTPISKVELIAGHVLAMFLVSLAQTVLLVVLGQLALGVDYLRQPLGILAMLVAVSLWVASLGLLISAVSRTEEHAVMWSMIAMMLLSALGGAWFPLDVTGKAFSTIGHLTPTAWAMDGLQNIVVRGLGTGSVLLPAGILLGYAAAFFVLAVWRFRFE